MIEPHLVQIGAHCRSMSYILLRSWNGFALPYLHSISFVREDVNDDNNKNDGSLGRTIEGHCVQSLVTPGLPWGVAHTSNRFAFGGEKENIMISKCSFSRAVSWHRIIALPTCRTQYYIVSPHVSGKACEFGFCGVDHQTQCRFRLSPGSFFNISHGYLY